MVFASLRYSNGKFEVLNQLLLPHKVQYVSITNCEDGWNVIKRMQVRGAPLIGVVAALSLAVELRSKTFETTDALLNFVTKQLTYLVTSRPTAVNITDMQDQLLAELLFNVTKGTKSVEEIKTNLIKEAESCVDKDVKTNKTLARNGAEHILAQSHDQSLLNILTHCNTGSLATAGYGTALGVVRSLHEQKRLKYCFFTETRPYNQGARLTAYELIEDEIPSILICDSMAASLMKKHHISAVVVGADRVTSNGDTANKIGTYQLAIAAKYHGVPFYVAAPVSSIDQSLDTGAEIVIEERPSDELTTVNGIQITPSNVNCWNPAFDITPAELITGGIVTEFGVLAPSMLASKLADMKSQT